jgi:hypothetical protein
VLEQRTHLATTLIPHAPRGGSQLVIVSYDHAPSPVSICLLSSRRNSRRPRSFSTERPR